MIFGIGNGPIFTLILLTKSGAAYTIRTTYLILQNLGSWNIDKKKFWPPNKTNFWLSEINQKNQTAKCAPFAQGLG